MQKLFNRASVAILTRRQSHLLWSDTQGQDLIEYAMLVGFVAVACAALIPYGVAQPIADIFSRLIALLNTRGNAGA